MEIRKAKVFYGKRISDNIREKIKSEDPPNPNSGIIPERYFDGSLERFFFLEVGDFELEF
jgi:hypothetical protein